MGDDTNTYPTQGRPEGAGRGQRPGSGNRDNGGFRIRLSDNEMQAARALQEAFQLRSTVAVLGFALRTLAQQLEAGQLDELVAQHRAQGGGGGGRSAAPRNERGGERRGERGAAGRGPRVDPFARPARPTPAPAAEEMAAEEMAAGEDSNAAEALNTGDTDATTAVGDAAPGADSEVADAEASVDPAS